MTKSTTATAPENPPQLTSLPATVESAENREREERRIAKWGRMLVPAVRDSGANIAKWRIEERKERKLQVSILCMLVFLIPIDISFLQERVFKGIPDRWRAAAWYTLMEQRAALAASKGDVMRAEALAVKYRVRLFLLAHNARH
jgi:USP6 N-terminal-like protein